MLLLGLVHTYMGNKKNFSYASGLKKIPILADSISNNLVQMKLHMQAKAEGRGMI